MGGEFRPIVRATMRTIHVDQYRRQRLWRRAVPTLVSSEDVPDAGVAIANADQVGRAMAGLSAQERTVVVLRFYDDLAMHEVAGAMGLAEGTVKRYLSNALAKLSLVLERDELDGERVHVVDGRGVR